MLFCDRPGNRSAVLLHFSAWHLDVLSSSRQEFEKPRLLGSGDRRNGRYRSCVVRRPGTQRYYGTSVEYRFLYQSLCSIRSFFLSCQLAPGVNCVVSVGLNVLLISRTEAKLAAASQEIASKFNVQTKYTVVDFAHADEATWRRTAAVMSTLNVGLLINNVGLSYDHPEYLEQLSEQQVRDMVEVNITSVNQVSPS